MVRSNIRHIILVILTIFMGTVPSYAQNIRYVLHNSYHSLFVPENPDYKYIWSMTWGNTQIPIAINSTTNVTDTINWSQRNTHYDISVYPVLDSVGCLGEPIYMTVYTVDYLSLHAFDDVFYIQKDTTLRANVSLNDFDEMGYKLVYNTVPISNPQYGTLTLDGWGGFTYTPNPGFVGVDQFVYEVNNVPSNSFGQMVANATVTIVVSDNNSSSDLYVSKTGPAKALFGETIGYNIIVKNNGPSLAENVMLKDTIPFGLFNPQYSLGTSPYKQWKDTLALGNINKGDSIIISIQCDISIYSPEGLWNQALTWSDNFDPDYSDNDSIWYTEVSVLYSDLGDFLNVSACRDTVIPNKIDGNAAIKTIRWRPSIGLNDSTIANPRFTPDARTIGKTSTYVLVVTDVKGNVLSDTIKIIVSDLPVALIESEPIDTVFMDIGSRLTISGKGSTGDRIKYSWWADKKGAGHIVGFFNLDSIVVDTTGLYHLRVTDKLKCVANDSVWVLLESHPPVAANDYVDIVAGTDSTINVLANDFDKNNFDLRVTRIITEPKHGDYLWDTLGNINFKPDITYWLMDSLEYEVCNNGIPQKCSSAWMIIHCLRPPLNADVDISKSTEAISFWGDSIFYDIIILSHGPDTALVVNLYDELNFGLVMPEFSYSTDNRRTWSQWKKWENEFQFVDPLIPNKTVFHLKIKAWIDPRADKKITNTAYINTLIVENNPINDTSWVESKIKQKVIARAGPDKILGACKNPIELDGNLSQGEGITFSWWPTSFLDDATSSTPTFDPDLSATGIFTFILTVTDNDGITDTDTVKVTVFAPPLADAGEDMFLKMGGQVSLDGFTGSSASSVIFYSWTTPNGHIIEGTERSSRPGVDSLGTYILTITDIAGCTDTDIAEVYRYYYPPFPIPDYYSTAVNVAVTNENVLDNDFDPNGLFDDVLSITPVVNMITSRGGRVTINSDGTFTYTPPPHDVTGFGFFIGVDAFSYQLCNSTPNGCARGYVKITVSNTAKEVCNLSIDKWVATPTVLIGKDVDYVIEIKNSGSKDLRDITITDSLDFYISNPLYSFDGISFRNAWTGELNNLPLDTGDSMRIYIRGRVRLDAPNERIINAAMVSSPTYDNCFDWGDAETRNVDTASVYIESTLIAIAELIEQKDGVIDNIIGVCDNLSILSAAKSLATIGIDSYEWLPSEYVTSDSTVTTGFNLSEVSDTTIIFTLIIRSGGKFKTVRVPVTFSPEVIVDAGPDLKINEGVPMTLNCSGQGAGVSYIWNETLNFENGNPLTPIITKPGIYILTAIDKHGCFDRDTVFIRENQLFALNDILVVIANTTLTGNVATNDYDPNNDSIYYTGIVTSGPLHGTLTINPPGFGGIVGTSGATIADNGTYIYSPNNGFTGDDYFIYQICDNNVPKLCVTGKVFIKVIDLDSINSPPVANHDVFFVNKNSRISGNLLANDYDYDGGAIALDISNFTPPKKGSLTLFADSTFTYIPYPNETGADSFYYIISDNGKPSKSDTTMVYIYINKIEEENHKPVAVDDAYYVVEKTITGNVMLNDYDPDGNSIYLDQFVTIKPLHGTFMFTDQYGSFEYTPDPGFEGTDLMIYQINEPATFEAFTTTATVYFTSFSEKRYKTDLVVIKSGPEYILSGDTIQYSITARVLGPTFANDVVISDTLFSALSKFQYSNDAGLSWKVWNGTFKIDRMELFSEAEILIRAMLPDSIWTGLPDIFAVDLPNTARVSHDMTELIPKNNDSTWITTVYQKVIAYAGHDTTIGSCITKYMLDASESIGMGKLQYKWVPGYNLDDPTLANPVFKTVPSTVQKFNLTVSSDYNGLFDSGSDNAEVWVEVGNTPVADPGEEFWNVIDTVTLDGGGSMGDVPITYLWWKYDKDKQVVEIDTTVTIDVRNSGDFYLTITDRFGCINTDQTHVGFKYKSPISVNDTVQTAQQEPTICIKVLRNDTIDPDDEYNLNFLTVKVQPRHGTITESPLDSCFIYTPDPYFIGYDTFTYIVPTESGFTLEAKVFIRVNEKPAIVPDGFSPNGDGINDFLIIENIEKYELNSIIIFNRWGSVVYKKTKYSNSEPWNGVANKGVRIGQGAVPAAIYLYLLDLGDDRVNQEINGVQVNNRIVKGNIYVATGNR